MLGCGAKRGEEGDEGEIAAKGASSEGRKNKRTIHVYIEGPAKKNECRLVEGQRHPSDELLVGASLCWIICIYRLCPAAHTSDEFLEVRHQHLTGLQH